MSRTFPLLLSLALSLAPSAWGTIVFTLDQSGCSNGCSVLPAGTVTIAQNGANDVRVTVQLGTDYSFRGSNDVNHHALVFNLAGNPAVSVLNVTSGDLNARTFSLNTGSGPFSDSPFGNFGYAMECTNCTPGMAGLTTRRLAFDLQAPGLTEASFVGTASNAGNIFFAVDVVGKTTAAGLGDTGNIGALQGEPGPNPDPSVPESNTALMLSTGVGLIAAGPVLRRVRATKV